METVHVMQFLKLSNHSIYYALYIYSLWFGSLFIIQSPALDFKTLLVHMKQNAGDLKYYNDIVVTLLIFDELN